MKILTDFEFKDGIKKWTFDGKIHREDGPAIISSRGKAWALHGQFHRLDGPALAFSDGSIYFFVKGKEYSQKEYIELFFEKFPKEIQEKLIFNGFDHWPK